jgi:structural maintenance of chromosome 3 (chondroitin sulfate proteoglycan 6)
LVSKLQFEAKFAPAVRAAFGRTLLCRNAHVASQCAKKWRVDCVTLDGDQVGRRGALTGGFHDARKSRLVRQPPQC